MVSAIIAPAAMAAQLTRLRTASRSAGFGVFLASMTCSFSERIPAKRPRPPRSTTRLRGPGGPTHGAGTLQFPYPGCPSPGRPDGSGGSEGDPRVARQEHRGQLAEED